MPVEENIHLVEQAFTAFNEHDMEGFVSFYAENSRHYISGRSEPLIGGGEVLRDNLAFMKTLPDVRFDKIRIFGQEDWVCLEGYVKGTHKDPLWGPEGSTVPPTGKEIQVPVCILIRLENGKAVEVREYNNQIEFLKQLGLLQ